MSARHKILQSSLLVFVLILCAKVLALVKDMILAYTFGQGELTDVYFIAFQIPNTLMYVFGITLLKGMSSSIFSESIALNRFKELSTVFSTVFNGVFILTTVITVICIWQMPNIIGLLPFKYEEASFDTIVLLARILFPLLVTLGLSNYLSATLNAYRNFFLPGFSLIIANLFMIFSLLFLADRLSILSLAYGTATGFLMAFLIQFIFIVKTKIPYKFVSLNFNSQPVRSFMRKSMPLILVTASGQITVLVSYIIALDIEEGMASALAYAGKINELTLALFVLPLLTVLLPEFARDKAANNIEGLKSRIRLGAEVITAIIVFWVTFLIVFYREVITILFERGEFTAADGDVTGRILFIFLIGMCFHAGQLLLTFIYLGLQKTKSLTVIGVSAQTVNIILLFVLSKRFGVYGLAWASAVTAVIYFSLLFVTFKRKYVPFSLLKHGGKFMKIIIAGIVVLFIFYGVQAVTETGTNALQNGLRLTFIGVAGIIVYMGMLHVFRIFVIKDTLSGIIRIFHEQN